MKKLSARLEKSPKILLPSLGVELTKKLYVELRVLLMHNGYEDIEPLLRYDYIELKKTVKPKLKDMSVSIEKEVSLEDTVDTERVVAKDDKKSVEDFVRERVPELVKKVMSFF